MQYVYQDASFFPQWKIKRDGENLFFRIPGVPLCKKKIVGRQGYIFRWAGSPVGYTGFQSSTQAGEL